MSNKRKFQLLLVAIPILAWLGYTWAISRTLDQKREYEMLEQEQQRLGVLQQNMQQLKQKEFFLDSVLNRMNLQNTSLENNLLRTLSEQTKSNHVQIVSYDPPHTFENEDARIYHFDVTLGGSLQGILNVIYALEINGLYGEIRHADIYLHNKRRQKKQVRARLLLRNSL